MSQSPAAQSTLTKLQATDLDHIVLWVDDLERSKHFYIDILGLTLLREHLGPDTGNHDPLDADWRCFLGFGDNQIGLFQRRDGLGEGRTRFNHLAVKIEAGSRDEVRAYLESLGVEVIGRENDPGCVYASDPDGHLVQLLTPLED
jgi:catechol 2,3-dioxygenase-like lactoylglutathione lyase family enzyme